MTQYAFLKKKSSFLVLLICVKRYLERESFRFLPSPTEILFPIPHFLLSLHLHVSIRCNISNDSLRRRKWILPVKHPAHTDLSQKSGVYFSLRQKIRYGSRLRILSSSGTLPASCSRSYRRGYESTRCDPPAPSPR